MRRELSRANFGKNAVATASGRNVAAFVIVDGRREVAGL